MNRFKQLGFPFACLPGSDPDDNSGVREAFHCTEDALDALQRVEQSLGHTLSERATVVSWFCPAWWRRRILARCFLRDVTLARADLQRVSDRLRRVASDIIHAKILLNPNAP